MARPPSSVRPATPTSGRTVASWTTRDTPDGTCAAFSATSPGGFGIGVDLNRNYGGFWGGPGASDLFADPTYRGAGPFSEPETRNVRNLISNRRVTMMISNHTFSNLGAASQRREPHDHRT
ncbi:M14 family zinc carboxypeptidase [Nocardioides sp. B-3]|uniref:M14 family zinc carboxypeptidase n=1 Tax=Nocardioides sp. B-3 TaxID=2895565 RepID=UPI003FA607C0